MKLTVVMSVYNGADYLPDSIESILGQTFKDFIFLIVNNGSNDNTPHILKKYKAIDKRIKIITSTKNLTYVEGRMLAITKVKTEWFAIMDADDISLPSRLEKQVNMIISSKAPIAALGTWAKYINNKGKILGSMRMNPTSISEFKKMLSDNQAIVLIDPSSIIHLPTFNLVGGYRSECVPAADLDLWYRLSEKNKALLVIPEYLIHYRVHNNSGSVMKTLSQRKKTHFINYNMRLRRKNCNEILWDEYLDTVWSNFNYRVSRLRIDFAMTFYKSAGLSYGEGKFIVCIINLIKAFVLSPVFVVKRLARQQIIFFKK